MFKSIKEFGIAKSIVASVVGVTLGLSALKFATAPNACLGVCTTDFNQVMTAKGFVKGKYNGEVPEGLNKEEYAPIVYMLEYNTGFSLQSGELFAEQIQALLPRIRKGDTIAINITSPGGSSVSCAHSYNQVNIAKSYGANVITFVDYFAASCGYELASASNFIIASPGSSIGNIGSVYTYNSNLMEAASKYFGVKKKLFGSTRIKELMAGAEPETEEDFKIMRGLALDSAESFYRKVLDGRGKRIDINKLDEIFSGKLFDSSIALKLGLIDAEGDRRSHYNLMHLKGYKIIKVEYRLPKEPGLISKIF